MIFFIFAGTSLQTQLRTMSTTTNNFMMIYITLEPPIFRIIYDVYHLCWHQLTNPPRTMRTTTNIFLMIFIILEPPIFWIIYDVYRVAELGSLSSGAKMAMKIFVKRVFTIFASNASFLRVIANLQN